MEPRKNVTSPTIVARVPSPRVAAFSSIACTAWAPVSPTRPRIWVTTSPRTASGPKKKPAIAIAMTRIGAMANSV